ncbi:MAG: hypothetical protein GY861_17665 [bacterium]|nr:hypothetical protein [bacterium]
MVKWKNSNELKEKIRTRNNEIYKKNFKQEEGETPILATDFLCHSCFKPMNPKTWPEMFDGKACGCQMKVPGTPILIE